MNKANIIRFKDFSDAKECFCAEEGKTVYEVFEGINFDDKIILCNGNKVYPDYKIKLGDTIVVRTIPKSATAWIIVGIVVGIAAGVTGLAIGISAKNDADKAAKLAEKLAKNSKDKINDTPYLRGANNSVATSKTQPYVIGEHFFTPYYLSSNRGNQQHFSMIYGEDGKDQYNYMVFECGFNNQVLRSISADDVEIKKFTGNIPQNEDGFIQKSLVTEETDTYEIRNDGSDFTDNYFNLKIVEQASSEELKKKDDDNYIPLMYTLSDNSYAADVCIMFNGLCTYNSDGDRISRTVEVNPYYSFDNGNTWNLFNFSGIENNSFSRNVLSQIRFNAHIDFTYQQIKNLQGPIQIKLECNTEKDDMAKDGIYCLWVHSYTYDKDASKSAGQIVTEKIIEPVERNL